MRTLSLVIALALTQLLTLLLRWKSTGALQGTGPLLIKLAFSCLNLNWVMWLLSKQATKVAPSSLGR